MDDTITISIGKKAIWAIVALERRYTPGSFEHFAKDQAEEVVIYDGISEAAGAIWDSIDQATREAIKQYGATEK
jgi:hypothetical protein